MSPAMSGKSFRLTRPIPHELFKKVFKVFSPIRTIPYIEKKLSTFECSWGYGPPIEMESVS